MRSPCTRALPACQWSNNSSHSPPAGDTRHTRPPSSPTNTVPSGAKLKLLTGYGNEARSRTRSPSCMHTVPLGANAKRVPSGLQPKPRGPAPRTRSSSFPSAASCIVRSRPRHASRLQSGENATVPIQMSLGSTRQRTVRVATSSRRRSPRSPPVARVVPSGANAAAMIGPPSTWSVRSNSRRIAVWPRAGQSASNAPSTNSTAALRRPIVGILAPTRRGACASARARARAPPSLARPAPRRRPTRRSRCR